MNIIPAIDLLQGACVRLRQGSFDKPRHYARDPLEVARSFAEQGARWIHLVDLDAARGHGGSNRKVLARISRQVSCGLQVGGGIRTEEDINALVDCGIQRLILGTLLVKDPDQIARWCQRYGAIFLAAIDALEGQVKISGWQEESCLQDQELAARAVELGIGGIVYTSIARDGTLQGPDIQRTNRMAAVSRLPIILSGGIGTASDVAEVFHQRHHLVEGVIIGKALYEGRVDLPTLIRAYQDPAFPAG